MSLKRCLIYVALLGLAVSAQAAPSVWMRAAYWDGRYPTSWARTGESTRDALQVAGYEILNADQLKTWMTARISDGKLSVVVFLQDVAPDTVIESRSSTCTLRRYLNAGGKIVWYADIPFYAQGHANGDSDWWGNDGAIAVLGFNTSSAPWGDSSQTTTLTAAGTKWGLAQTWFSWRALVSSGTTNLTILATDPSGNAAAWVKHYVANDDFRGFVRFRDRDGQADVRDIAHVAEFIGTVAFAPQPANGAIGVSSTTLSWTAGSAAKQHDVYFGATSSPPLIKRQTGTTYVAPTFTAGKKYYWRIDEVEADGKTIHKGTLWSFTALSSLARDPFPTDGAENVFPDGLLDWLTGDGAAKHHLYLGTDSAAVTARAATTNKGLLTTSSFAAGVLRSATTYYWLVDEVQSNGTVKQGTLWRFTTEAGRAQKVLREWWTGISGGTVADLTNDPRFPDQPTGSEWLDDFEGPVNWGDNYGSRLRGWLVAPKSGTYRFWIASDDSSELWLSTNADPAKATKIASLNGATGARYWTAQPGQKSAAISLTAGQKYYIEALMKEGGGGDHVSVAWQPPGETQNVIPGEFVDGFALPPLQASSPDPENEATEVAQNLTLSWSAGEQATQHRVYFGTDEAAVAAADTTTPGLYKGEQSSTTFQPGSLAWGQTYYWRVDEVTPDLRKGNVWSFTTIDFLPVDDFESYDNWNNGQPVGAIWTVWKDGLTNGTGSTVGKGWMTPSTETAIVHGGKQSMPLAYDNAVLPHYSETTRQWSSAQDWTNHGVTTLSLWLRAQFVKFLEEPAGTITMSAGGKDIWDASDEFRFAYKRLSGNGTIVARVEQVASPSGYTDGWAKAGVMIRESLNPGARFAAVYATPGNGVRYQARLLAASAATSDTATATAEQITLSIPVWIKLDRSGNNFSCSYSTDGTKWTAMSWNPQSITMTGSIYIGLAVTSHYSWGAVTAKLSHVATTGSVTGSWTVADIGINHPGNQPDSLYVTLQDASGATATVKHPDNPQAVLKTDWTQWKIPLSDFTGVDRTAISRLTIGVGDRTDPTPTSDGELFIDDIRVIK